MSVKPGFLNRFTKPVHSKKMINFDELGSEQNSGASTC